MDFKDTLSLPRTEFKMKANLAGREPEILDRWEKDDIYSKILDLRSQAPLFVLHDGPPYANGSIHYGHILNKVLKDIVVRYKTMAGFKVLFVPGWDCHGLPIEIHVDKSLKEKKKGMSQVEIRQACKEYALSYVDIQRKEFKRLGCVGTWDRPYLTLDPSYEATVVRELGRFIEKGFFYRGRKPVYWCGPCGTALAEAEVEYKERTSPSIYVKLLLEEHGGLVSPELEGKELNLVIWTTTPWTIPANLAVTMWPDFPYVALEVELSRGRTEHLVVADALSDSFVQACGLSGKVKAKIPIKTEALEGRRYRHPLMSPRSDKDYRVWFAPHVTLDQGTGLVHTAPGHGAEDYLVGLDHGLEIFAPVDNEGKFTSEVPAYQGTYVHNANEAVVKDLVAAGALLNRPGETLTHSYPHCWRCKQPIVFRATPQWFITMDHDSLRGRALDQIDKTRWIPPWGHDRIFGMVQGRPDWCMSRQRVWGVPLPILYCARCKEPVLSADLAFQVADLFAEHGSDIWFELSAQELAPEDLVCPSCKGERFVKEKDIVDVWFESGVSWAAVCEDRADLGVPVDLYLEGSDQHRGWFHSALLTGVGTRGKAPYKAVLTHGFVVDETGQPYSKTLKNYEPPERIIQRLGAEIFRLWVAYEDYRNDIRISEEILKRLSEGYRRIRNTCRFMLGVLSDHDPDRPKLPEEELFELDRLALSELANLKTRVRKAYDDYEYHKVYHALLEFSSVELSSFYLDVAKDRLYCDGIESKSRKAAQQTVYEILKTVTTLMAPICCFTAEEIWSHMPRRKGDPESVHAVLLSDPDASAREIDPELGEAFKTLRELRQQVNKALEPFRAQKHHSLDARVLIRPGSDYERKVLVDKKDQLADLFIVSLVELAEKNAQGPSAEIEVCEYEAMKCPRCWKRTDRPVSSPWGEVCPRCRKVLADDHAQP